MYSAQLALVLCGVGDLLLSWGSSVHPHHHHGAPGTRASLNKIVHVLVHERGAQAFTYVTKSRRCRIPLVYSRCVLSVPKGAAAGLGCPMQAPCRCLRFCQRTHTTNIERCLSREFFIAACAFSILWNEWT